MEENLNPFEFTIYSYLKENEKRRFTEGDIAKNCNINIRTVQKYLPQLLGKRLIKKEKDRTKIIYYYE